MNSLAEEEFLSVETNEDLANYLGISLRTLAFYAYSEKNFYKKYRIQKKDGKSYRVISVPNGGLKKIQRKIADGLTSIYSKITPKSVHGFIKGKSIVTNAAMHVDKRFIIKVDIKDFFPSIASGRVHNFFQKKPFKFSKEVCNTLTNLLCEDHQLPQGSPASPILSNMICLKIDKSLIKYCKDKGIYYTRYADDLTFSANSQKALLRVIKPGFEENIELVDNIRNIIESNHFKINNLKSGLYKRGGRQVVTGVVVNKKCNFRRSDYDYLRNMFSYWKKTGSSKDAALRYIKWPKGFKYRKRFFDEDGEFCESIFINHIKGLLSFYSMVVKRNKDQSIPIQRLWTLFHDISGVDVPDMLPECSLLRLEVIYRSRKVWTEKFEETSVLRHGNWEDDGGWGTAFIIKGNKCLTAFHCIHPLEEDKKEEEGSYKIILTNTTDDNIEESNEPPIAIKQSRKQDWAILNLKDSYQNGVGITCDFDLEIQIGQKIIAYGFAHGNSELRKIDAIVTERLDGGVYVVDRAFISGMSGGPVLSKNGKVIGVITKGSGENMYDRDGQFISIKSIFSKE